MPKALFGVSGSTTGLTALAFTGGCLAVAVLFMPMLWRPRALAAFAGSAVIIALTILAVDGTLWDKYSALQGSARRLGAKSNSSFG